MPTTTMTALRSGTVFAAPIMARITNVTSPVPRLVRMKVIERLLSTRRNRPIVPATRIIAIVNVSVKSVTAMKPWPCSDE